MKRITVALVPGFLALALSLPMPGPSFAATWYVTEDPENPEGRIEAVLAQVSSGDSIVVGPGMYYEHLVIPVIDLTIIGSGGAASTILDGSRGAPDHPGSILSSGPGASTTGVSLVGLTLQNGTGTVDSGVTEGGAIFFHGVGRVLTVRDCRFVDNHATGYLGWGGAISAGGLASLRVEGSSFQDNTSSTGGGAIRTHACSNLTIADSEFSLAVGTGPSAFVETMLGEVVVTDCRFSSEGGGGSDNGFRFDSSDVDVSRCVFLDRSWTTATVIFLLHSWEFGDPIHMVFRGNVFWRAPSVAWDEVGIVCDASPGNLTLDRNTFYRVDIRQMGLGQDIDIERNIIVEAECHLECSGVCTVNCNDVWPAGITILPPGHPVNGENFSLDPLFCGADEGDLQLAENSPCAAANSPTGCGQIGALTTGCQVVPVVERSWGRIKFLMRGER